MYHAEKNCYYEMLMLLVEYGERLCNIQTVSLQYFKKNLANLSDTTF
jgi:hypothetical protein